jgi:hypothetical protein
MVLLQGHSETHCQQIITKATPFWIGIYATTPRTVILKRFPLTCFAGYYACKYQFDNQELLLQDVPHHSQMLCSAARPDNIR